MARRLSQNTWFFHAAATSLATGVASTFVLLSNTEGGIGANAALLRLMGCINVFVDNQTQGAVDMHMWHGAILVDAAMGNAPLTIDNANPNVGSWLWREPIQLYHPARVPTQTDYSLCQRVDWQIRSGRGSTAIVAQEIRYVVFYSAGSPPDNVNVDFQLMALYQNRG